MEIEGFNSSRMSDTAIDWPNLQRVLKHTSASLDTNNFKPIPCGTGLKFNFQFVFWVIAQLNKSAYGQ